MNENLQKRIFTSFFLIILLTFGIITNAISWLILLVISSAISFIEFKKLTTKICIKKTSLFYLINFCSLIYLFFFIYASYLIYLNSIFFLIYSILICIFSDTGGYIFGKLIGGKKLTKISPNKTIAGSLGSLFFSQIPVFIFLIFDNKIQNINYDENNIILLIFISLFLSMVCQLGDLFISYIKRLSKVKDTGSILPGHGGLLDRIDGAIFVLPVSFIIFKLFLVQ